MPMVCRITSIGLGPFPHYHQLQVVCKVTASYSASSEMEDKRRGLDEFQTAVEETIKPFRPTRNIKHRTARFIDAMITAAKNTCGQNKPGKRTKSWLTPEVKTKIKRRNQLRKGVRIIQRIANTPQQEREDAERRRQEWIKACQDVVTATRDAKAQSWRNLLQDAVHTKDDTKLWGIIKNFNGL